MGFSFKKLLKKGAKLVGKVAKPALSLTPVGRIALRAQQTLKSLGGNLKAARLGKVEPLSVVAGVEKIATAGPARRLRSFRRAATSVRGSRMPQKRRTAKPKGKRAPPRGGLDLKAMSVQWRAAGKPGTWRDWIKTNQLRKAG
jgi:hypothetical protein